MPQTETPNVLRLSKRQTDYILEAIRSFPPDANSLGLTRAQAKSVAFRLKTLIGKRGVNVDNLDEFEKGMLWQSYNRFRLRGGDIDCHQYKAAVKISRGIYAKFRVAGLVPPGGSPSLSSRDLYVPIRRSSPRPLTV